MDYCLRVKAEVLLTDGPADNPLAAGIFVFPLLRWTATVLICAGLLPPLLRYRSLLFPAVLPGALLRLSWAGGVVEHCLTILGI